MGYPIPIPYIHWFGMMKYIIPSNAKYTHRFSAFGSRIYFFFGPMQVVFLLGCDMMGYDGKSDPWLFGESPVAGSMTFAN